MTSGRQDGGPTAGPSPPRADADPAPIPSAHRRRDRLAQARRIADAKSRTGSAARATTRRTTSAARATTRATTAAARAARARVQRATHAHGAGASGLSKLIELHAVNAAGDAMIAVSLAGTLFFSVPTGEARGKVALYLLVTMAPFIVMAPIIGPVLDRFRHGRRGAMAGSFALRGFLAWVMADAVTGGGIELYPAAFGVLVASKAYVLSRSATVPRLLPPGVSLVKANARVSLAGVVGVAIGTPLGIGLAWIGSEWSLRVAFLVFVLGTILAAMLPRAVDSSEGEVEANVLQADTGALRPRLGSVGPAVVLGLRANAAIRAVVGFLTIYLLFLVREEPVGGLSTQTSVVLIVASALVGGTIGSIAGSTVRARAPEPIIVAVLGIAALVALVTAMFYGALTVAVLAVTAAFGQQLGKLSLDAQIQRDVPERVRSSAFARAETAVQLAWVLGGGLGIVLPLHPTLGTTVVAGGLLATLVTVARSFLALRRQRRAASLGGGRPATG